MRSLWKGSIGFGLVNIPIRLYAATESKSVQFTLLHELCRTPVKYRKVCPHCDRELTQDEIVRGFEFEKGRYVVVTSEDLESLPVETVRQVQIVEFVDLSEIDPVYFDKSYYLEPDQGAEKPYALLRRAMLEAGKIAVAKVAIRSKESLACVRAMDGVLVMETMFYPDEIRSVQGLAGVAAAPPLSGRELEMARQLIENLSEPFDPGKYRDNYREALLERIRQKVEGGETGPAAQPPAGRVIDLMEALEASLKATARRGAAKEKAATRAGDLDRGGKAKREGTRAKRGAGGA